MREPHMERSSKERETGEGSRDESAEGASKPERERRPFSYYYDDGTGYELFDPSKEEEEEDEPSQHEKEA